MRTLLAVLPLGAPGVRVAELATKLGARCVQPDFVIDQLTLEQPVDA